jgi:putative two-component system response regulator
MEPTGHILVVDDQADNRLILEDLLGEHYVVHLAVSGEEAIGHLALGHPADLILLDVMMPGIDGFEVCRQLKADHRTREIPVLFLTSLDRASDEAHGLSLGAEDFIHKPFSPPVVLARVRNHLQLASTRRALERRNEDLATLVAERTREVVQKSEELLRRSQEVLAAQGATITAFCSLAEARDNETGNHIRRTQNYVQSLAKRLCDHPRFRAELDEESIRLLYRSAPLHDIGKVAIPDAILNKPGKLTADQWTIMKKHTEFGRDAIVQAESEFTQAHSSFLRLAREIAYGHHERWDGNGYPQGLAGEAIPTSARLMAVADVYDALISKRVYKPAFPHQQAIAMIVEERGRHFDPDVVDALSDAAEEFADIARHFSDDSN